MIRLAAISHTFPNGGTALRDVSLAVAPRETLALIGPSGCGKSTLLKTINGLIRPTLGRIYVDGQPLDYDDCLPLRRRIGYAIQEVGLFPHLNVADNVTLMAHLEGWSEERRTQRCGELLELVGLTPARIGPKFPRHLSGGEAQRVGIARALMLDPPILLLDEPFGALDPITRRQLQREFKSLESGIHKTIVLVTHDLHEAFFLGDRVALMQQGALVQVGTPEEIRQRPVNDFVARFVQDAA